MTSLRSVILTGSPGIGKTTLVRKFSGRGCIYEGFLHNRKRWEGQRVGFDVVTFDGQTFPLAIKRKGGDRSKGMWVGSYEVLVDSFEKAVVPILQSVRDSFSCAQSSKKYLLVIDEIGKMELFGKQFKLEIDKLFQDEDQEKMTILATVPERSISAFVEEIKQNPTVKLFQVTKSNRDSIYQHIVTLLSSLLTSHSLSL